MELKLNNVLKPKIMAKLSVKQQGIRGGNPSYKDNVGYIAAFIGESSIVIDAFEGYGETYKRRSTPQIEIRHENKRFVFNSIFDLIKELSK